MLLRRSPRGRTRATTLRSTGTRAAGVLTTVPLAFGLVAVPAYASLPVSGAVLCATTTAEAARNQTLTFTLVCSSIDGARVTDYRLVAAPALAEAFSLDAATGRVGYRPARDAAGVDSFTFVGVDAGGRSSEVTSATVSVPNERPQCAKVAAVHAVRGRATVVPQCSDGDGDLLDLRVTTGPRKGVARVHGGVVTYRALVGASGRDTFVVVVADGVATSAARTVTVRLGATAPRR